jgi:hypothetical protein
MVQGSEAIRRQVGACRILDPTTAGDFLRRFKTAPQVPQLSEVIDDIVEAVGVAETFSVELGRGFELTFTATGSSSEWQAHGAILSAFGAGNKKSAPGERKN